MEKSSRRRVRRAALDLIPRERALLARDLLRSLEGTRDEDYANWFLFESEARAEARRAAVRAKHSPAALRAYEILDHHSNSPEGLLFRLRPYVGIDPQHLADLLEALEVLRVEARAGRGVAPAAVCTALSILDMIHGSAIHPGGMLRRNRLIEAGDLETLWDWASSFSRKLSLIMDAAAAGDTWTTLTDDDG